MKITKLMVITKSNKIKQFIVLFSIYALNPKLASLLKLKRFYDLSF